MSFHLDSHEFVHSSCKMADWAILERAINAFGDKFESSFVWCVCVCLLPSIYAGGSDCNLHAPNLSYNINSHGQFTVHFCHFGLFPFPIGSQWLGAMSAYVDM